jgi:hypothetical protein
MLIRYLFACAAAAMKALHAIVFEGATADAASAIYKRGKE